MFNPSEVFRRLYWEACQLGIREFSNLRQLSSDLVCKDIEAHIISMFSRMKHSTQSSSALRRQILERNVDNWKLVELTFGCLSCLQRTQGDKMECGHAICDACVCIFGKLRKGLEYYYDLILCPICLTRVTFQSRQVPPTCRMRLVSIDGGGCRGVVSIGFIIELQRALALPYPVQEHFDFAIGTSTGKIMPCSPRLY